MRDALALERRGALPARARARPALQRYISRRARTPPAPRDELRVRDEAWAPGRRAAERRLCSVRRPSWLVLNPFEPAGAQSGSCCRSFSERRLVGVVMAAARVPLALDPTSAIVLIAARRPLGRRASPPRACASSSSARRSSASGCAWPREIHDGLAQDLALAVRELALLDSAAAADLAAASCERLREALASARRVVRARLRGPLGPVAVGGSAAGGRGVCRRARRAGSAAGAFAVPARRRRRLAGDPAVVAAGADRGARELRAPRRRRARGGRARRHERADARDRGRWPSASRRRVAGGRRRRALRPHADARAGAQRRRPVEVRLGAGEGTRVTLEMPV